MPRVFLRDLSAGYDTAIGEAMEFLCDAAALRPGLRVSVKPNLTFPVYRRGVMTTPEAVEARLRHLKAAVFGQACSARALRVAPIPEALSGKFQSVVSQVRI